MNERTNVMSPITLLHGMEYSVNKKISIFVHPVNN